MVSARSIKVSRVSMYSGSCLVSINFRIRAFHPLWTDFPNRSPNVAYRDDSPNPSMHARWFGLFPFRSPLLRKSNVSFSSSPYLDVSVQEVPNLHLWIQYRSTGVCPARFPHSEICGSMDMCSSPQLIAACHVFHRLSVPRHSPCALLRLTFLLK